LPALREFRQYRRKVKRFEGWNSRREEANAGSHRTPLVVNIGAAADAVGADKPEVERSLLCEFAVLFGTEKREEQILNLLTGQQSRTGGIDGAVQSKRNRRAYDEENIGGVTLSGEGQELFEIRTGGRNGLQHGPCGLHKLRRGRRGGSVQFGYDALQFVVVRLHVPGSMFLF